MIQNVLTPLEMVNLAAGAADSKKAKNIQVLDTDTVSGLADYFVICSGDSKVQIRAIADAIEEALEVTGESTVGTERDQNGHWVLLDYGDLVVHVIHPEERDFYQLEQFWNHAQPVPREKWENPLRKVS